MRKIIAAFVAPVLVVVALVVGASTAHAQPSGSIDIAFGDQGELIGKGAVVIVPAEVTCTFTGNFLFGEFQVGLRQAQGGHRLVSAMGGGSISASDCDGTTHTVDLTFFPSDAPFRPGVAVISGSATIGFSDPDTGEQGFASDSEPVKEIRLKN